jgi:glutamyl-tRNA reductase
MLRSARAITNGNKPTPLLVLDIAAPRDVEPGAREIAGVRLFDLDDLRDRLEEGAASRAREVPRVREIIEEEVARFEAWARAAALRPLFAAVREHAESIRKAEVARALRRGADLSPHTRELLEHLSSSLVTKLLHGPTRRMRSEPDEERRRLYEDLVLELFELDAGADETERRAG